MTHDSAEARDDYQTAFDEGMQASADGASPDASNPYDDWTCPRAMKRGWRDGFDAGQAAREEWEAVNHRRALEFSDL